MVEMCTRHHPFHEIDHVGPEAIVQMVGRLVNYDKNVTLVVSKLFFFFEIVYNFYTLFVELFTVSFFLIFSWIRTLQQI